MGIISVVSFFISFAEGPGIDIPATKKGFGLCAAGGHSAEAKAGKVNRGGQELRFMEGNEALFFLSQHLTHLRVVIFA